MLSRQELSGILLGIAVQDHEGSRELIRSSSDLSEADAELLLAQVQSDRDAAANARSLGDALRSLSAPLELQNECYRAAFYLGNGWSELAANPLYAQFTANRAGKPIDKWVHYFPIYERHLARYRGKPVRVLEIGVQRGGGLSLLRNYLGPQAETVGVDIDATARLYAPPESAVEIGDQADPVFLAAVERDHGPFDVIIDDGGHTMRQQITSVETLFPLLNDGGAYIVEDCHTSYWPEFSDAEGGATFIDWAKARIDDLNAYYHSREIDVAEPWQTDLDGLHIYDSVVVLDKKRRFAPFSEVAGSKEFLTTDRLTVSANLELIAARDRAANRVAQLEARASEIEARETHAIELAVHYQSLQSRLDETEAQLREAKEELQGAWWIIRTIRRSKSWRITMPFRAFKSIVLRRR